MSALHQKCRECGNNALHAPDAEYGVCVDCELDDIRYSLRHPGARIWRDLREDEHDEARDFLQSRYSDLLDFRSKFRKSNPPRDDVIRFAGYDIDLVPTGPGRGRETRIRRDVVDTSAPGDYGADPLGDGMFRMVPSGDVVDHAERNRRLGEPSLRGNPYPAPTMSDSDPVQIWTYTERSRGDDNIGPVKTKTAERVDFNKGVIESHTTGYVEGEYIDNRSVSPIRSSKATPESAAAYRRRHGYTRIG